MWLLNTTSFKLKEFISSKDAEYAILSHRWRDEEVLFKDMDNFESCQKVGVAKVRSACQVAREDGYEHIWIDTCCIDKSSSAELGEAINSMFAWYADSQICYVFLDDVLVDSADQQFTSSSWFGRCWTLQELIAPRKLTFFDKQWTGLGCKKDLVDELFTCTGIPRIIFTTEHPPLNEYCVAQKFCWAANRQATRIEDYAYSLLGILGVAMTLNYGEGWTAFQRLQKKILKKTIDFTMLMFEDGFENSAQQRRPYETYLAERPVQFAKCGFLKHISYRVWGEELALEIKHDHLILATFVAKVTDKLIAAFIAREYGTQEGREYYLLLRHCFDNSYVRLNSPSQLLGTTDSGIADIGLWSPPPGYTYPSFLPLRRLRIVPNGFHQPNLPEVMEPITICGFDISRISTLPSVGIWNRLSRSAMVFSRADRVNLLPGAFRDPENNRVICVYVPGRNQYAPVCNVHFSLNQRGLLLGHFAIKVCDNGRISPICIILDSTFGKQTLDRDLHTGILKFEKIQQMIIRYSTPTFLPIDKARSLQESIDSIDYNSIYNSLIDSALRHGNSSRSSWIYVGKPAINFYEIQHFFMFKEDRRSNANNIALSYGHVELAVNTQYLDQPDPKILWNVEIEECYDGIMHKQKAL